MSSEGMPTVRLDSGKVRWEYRVAHIPTSDRRWMEFDIQEMGDYLNKVGDDGWELVSMMPVQSNGNTTGIIATLKRQS